MASVAGADAYFNDGLRADEWNKYDTDDKQRSINDATSIIKRIVFSTSPPSATIDNAIYEQSLCLLQIDPATKKRMSAIMSGLKSFTVSKQSETYSDVGLQYVINGSPICPNAYSYIEPYIQTKGTVRTGQIRC